MKKNFWRKTICLFIAFVMLAVSFTFPAAAEDAPIFSDVPEDHWAYDYINECVSRGILNGYPDGTFNPEGQLKVGEFIKMVVCAYSPKCQKTVQEKNLSVGGHWARPYVKIGDKDFFNAEDYETDESLERVITRLEASRMIVSMYILLNYKDDSKNHLDKTGEYLEKIKDADLLEDEWDRNYVNTAIKTGLICGFEDGTFRPYDGLTRAQAAKIIYLALTN